MQEDASLRKYCTGGVQKNPVAPPATPGCNHWPNRKWWGRDLWRSLRVSYSRCASGQRDAMHRERRGRESSLHSRRYHYNQYTGTMVWRAVCTAGTTPASARWLPDGTRTSTSQPRRISTAPTAQLAQHVCQFQHPGCGTSRSRSAYRLPRCEGSGCGRAVSKSGGRAQSAERSPRLALARECPSPCRVGGCCLSTLGSIAGVVLAWRWRCVVLVRCLQMHAGGT